MEVTTSGLAHLTAPLPAPSVGGLYNDAQVEVEGGDLFLDHIDEAKADTVEYTRHLQAQFPRPNKGVGLLFSQFLSFQFVIPVYVGKGFLFTIQGNEFPRDSGLVSPSFLHPCHQPRQVGFCKYGLSPNGDKYCPKLAGQEK